MSVIYNQKLVEQRVQVSTRKLRNGLLILFSLASAITYSVQPVSAAVSWDSKGYFTGEPMQTDNWEVVIRNCAKNGRDAFPSWNFQQNDGTDYAEATQKANFISLVESYYDGCGITSTYNGSTTPASYNKARNKVGGKFIMARITGDDSPTKAEFEAVMANPDIKINYSSYTYTQNSAHNLTVEGNHDVAWETGSIVGTSDTKMSVVLYYKGEAKLGIKANCGNMVGKVTLPYMYWHITPEVSVSNVNAKIGGSATFTYTATVSEDPSPIKQSVGATYTNSGSASGGGSFPEEIPANSKVGTSIKTTQTIDFRSNGTYCSKATVPDYGQGEQSYSGTIHSHSKTDSEPICVKVAVDPCRPIGGTGIFPIKPNSYDKITNDKVTVNATGIVPVNVDSGVGKIWGPFETTQTTLDNDFTTRNTTGDVHKVYKKDARNHATRIVTNYKAAYRGYSVGKKYTALKKAILTTDPKFKISDYPKGAVFDIDYKYSYSNSTVYYSDGDTRTLTTGTAPTYTNTNGSVSIGTTGPCYDYTLTTSSSNVGGNYESGSSITLNNSIISSSWTEKNDKDYYSNYKTWTKSKNIEWYLTKFVINPGVALPAEKAGGESSNAPCAYYGFKVCTTESQGFTVNPKGTGNVTYDFNIPDLKAGTKICFAFSVFTNQSDPSNDKSRLDITPYYHSSFNPTTNCLLIVKKPKVQVWSGDLSVGKALSSKQEQASIASSSQSVKSGLRYGSWVEYAIYATSWVKGIASGSGLSDGRASNDCSINLLTYTNPDAANSCTGNLGGSYKYSSNMKNYTSYFSATTALPSTNLNEIKTSGVYSSADKILSLTSNAAIDKSIIINAPNTDVVINDDISIATGNYTSLSQLPQVVIIAKSIKIDESVSNIDAWLLAPSGSIDTCTIKGARPNALTVNSCDNQLTVNGPVVANKLYLYRTYGSDPKDESGIPAEIFNLRADAYLWMYNRSAGDNRWRSTYVTELPPRL